jgi:co-chaperonin GroES (HSP10)
MQLSKNKTVVQGTSASDLVSPRGYQILVSLAVLEIKTSGGIFLPDDQVKRDQTAQVCSHVVALGPDCYKDETRFPSGPRCKVGDWIVMKSYAGVRLKARGEELRLINDDDVLAVLPQGPLEIERA